MRTCCFVRFQGSLSKSLCHDVMSVFLISHLVEQHQAALVNLSHKNVARLLRAATGHHRCWGERHHSRLGRGDGAHVNFVSEQLNQDRTKQIGRETNRHQELQRGKTHYAEKQQLCCEVYRTDGHISHVRSMQRRGEDRPVPPQSYDKRTSTRQGFISIEPTKIPPNSIRQFPPYTFGVGQIGQRTGRVRTEIYRTYMQSTPF